MIKSPCNRSIMKPRRTVDMGNQKRINTGKITSPKVGGVQISKDNGAKRMNSEELKLQREMIQTEILSQYNSKIDGFSLSSKDDSYTCQACKERFCLPTGLEMHLKRKVVKILHSCGNCGQDGLKFYNRCTLLYHLKLHNITPSVQYLEDKITIDILPESNYLSFEYGDDAIKDTPVPTVSNPAGIAFTGQSLSSSNSNGSLKKEVDQNMTEAGSKDICNEVKATVSIVASSNSADSEQQNIEKPENGHIYEEGCRSRSNLPDYWCSSCNKDFGNQVDFLHHLQESEKSGIQSKSIFRCSKDEVPNRSFCQYLFHNKIIHEKQPPFLCPDCGICHIDYQQFRDHLRNKCFYLSKRLRYGCNMTSCSSLHFKAESEIIEHLQDGHTKPIIQCIQCPQAFATCQWFLKHLAEIHNLHFPSNIEIEKTKTGIVFCDPSSKEDSLTNNSDHPSILMSMSKLLFQCGVCNVLFYTRAAYIQHLYFQLNTHNRIVHIYECPDCQRTFQDISGITNHHKTCQGLDHEAPISNLSLEHLGQKYSNGLYQNEDDCKNGSSHLESSVEERLDSSYSGSKQCQYCSQHISMKSLRRHEDQCSRMTKTPITYCVMCKSDFGKEEALWIHGMSHLYKGHQVCLLCNNREIFPLNPEDEVTTVEQKLALEKHILSTHVNKLELPFVCFICKQVIKERRTLDIHLKEHHLIDKIQKFVNQSPSTVTFKPDSVLDSEKKVEQGFDPDQSSESQDFCCPLCKFKEFRDRPSLTRHLTIVHKVDLSHFDMPSLYSDEGQSMLGETKLEKLRSSNYAMSSCNLSVPYKIRRLEYEADEQNSSLTSQGNTNMCNEGCISLSCDHDLFSAHFNSDARKEDGSIVCLQCEDSVFNDEDDFLSHVKWKHVWSEQVLKELFSEGKEKCDFWCPECGQTFVAKPSLLKHLKSVHEFLLPNFSDYLSKTGYDGKKPLKEYQCEVCYHQSTDGAEYHNHIRTHGMAFLRFRQKSLST